MSASPLPCVLIGGWLGAGKTTLVNQLLRQAAGRRLAVLVNDFGEQGLDADLIEGSADEVLELAGGCICCSYGADLLGALRRVAARQPRPDALLLETSGVSDPAAVARSLTLIVEVALAGIVVVADAQTLATQLADAYVGDTVCQQLAAADLLLLNKIDGVGLAQRQAWQRQLGHIAPCARLIESVQAELPIEVALGLSLEDDHDHGSESNSGTAARALRVSAPDASRFVSRSGLLPAAQDLQALALRLTATSAGVLRAKGLLTDANGQRHLLQVVGTQSRISPAPTGATGPDRLAVIGLRDAYDGTPWT